MKKLFFILCLLCVPIAFGMSNSPLFETYIGSTKCEIVQDLNDKSEKFMLSDRIPVRVDSLNNWIVNDNYYTYFFDFEDGGRLTTSFSLKNNICTNYMYDFVGYEEYPNQVQLFNECFQRVDSTTWYDTDSRSVLKLFPKGYKNGFSMYVYKKSHIDPYKIIWKEYDIKR